MAFSFRVSDYTVLLSPPCSVHRQAVSFTWEPRFRKNNIFQVSVHLLVKYEFLWSGTAQSGIIFTSFNCDFAVPYVIKFLLSKMCKFCPICKLNLCENSNSVLFCSLAPLVFVCCYCCMDHCFNALVHKFSKSYHLKIINSKRRQEESSIMGTHKYYGLPYKIY
jgi:hypothetical protein